MLRTYINDHQNDLSTNLSSINCTYNNPIKRSTQTTPFELVSSRPSSPFSLHRSVSSRSAPDRESKKQFLYRIDGSIQNVYGHLIHVQELYKKDIGRWIREVNWNIKVDQYVFLDEADCQSKPRQPTADTAPNSRLRSPAIGPCLLLSSDKRTFVIDRDSEVERLTKERVVHAPPPSHPPPGTIHNDIGCSCRQKFYSTHLHG